MKIIGVDSFTYNYKKMFSLLCGQLHFAEISNWSELRNSCKFKSSRIIHDDVVLS